MTDDIIQLKVRVKPRASRDGIEGWREGSLVVRLTSPPVEGAANSSLIKLLSKKLGIAKGRIRISSGEKSREKRVEISGLTLDEIREGLK